MKKLLSVLLTTIMLLSLVACGGGNSKDADNAYVGKWVSVSGTAMGITLTGDDISGFAFDLKAGGKGKVTVEGDSSNMKWKNDDEKVTITVDGEELIGTIEKDTLVFKDFLGLGMDITFAKEGTDAAKPENNLPEEEQKIVGTWSSYKVTDVLGDDASGEISADALKMTINGDHTVDIEFNGESIKGKSWSMFGTFGTIEESDFTWDTESGELEVTYNGDDYWIFTCKK